MSENDKSTNSVPDYDKNFKKKFGELPLDEKLTTLLQLEAATMSDAMNKIVDKSISLGEKVMDQLSSRDGRNDNKESASNKNNQ